MAKKILIIEDSPTIVLLLTQRIGSAGYDVISAPDGIKGLKMIREERPDLVVLDVRMPGLDGFEVCKRAKSDPDIKDIPIVFVTTAAQTVEREKGKEAGCDAYVTKPYDGKMLLDEIKRMLG